MFFDEIWLRVVLETAAAGFIAPAFAMLFAVPRKCLPYVAVGGAVTRCLRSSLVIGAGIEIVLATFIACAAVSLIFIYIGPKLKIPRPVFTVASIIALIPGFDAYNALISFISMVESVDDAAFYHYVFTLMHSGTRFCAILLAIALGIAVPPLFFYNYRHRHI